jgi:predicted nucleic acid-binding protein
MTSAARAIVDTGFLVALAHRDDADHAWATRLASVLPGPWLTCEACVTETAYLLGKVSAREAVKLYHLLDEGLLLSQHLLPEQLQKVRAEIGRYHQRAVDFADACLMVLSDAQPRLPIATVDAADFAVYLRGRRPRRLFTPAAV